ncbi:hypothetical protein CLOM_g12960 [Closterium sp. NIES-68]|nr:hypothetical protein CLOM_g12960 [Closterium sp. NIES-68]GJP61153.1 hypothetical protein CLOP_g18352 [Closterium sp. NIES-67]
MDDKKSRKRGPRHRRGVLILVLLLVGIAAFLGFAFSSSTKYTSRNGIQQSDGVIGQASEGGSGWSLLGQGMLEAVGKVLSFEERQKVSEDLKESGDDDHEAEAVPASAPPGGGRATGDMAAAAAAAALKPRGGASSSSSAAAAVDDNPLRNKTMVELSALAVGVTVERVPLSGFMGVDGRLGITDGTCHATSGERDCLPHGICIDGKCHCTLPYQGDYCRSARRPFVRKKSTYDGRFVLSVRHVRKAHGVKYPLTPSPGSYAASNAAAAGGAEAGAEEEKEKEGEGAAFFEAPFFTAGKVNRVVWGNLQKGKLMELEPMVSQALLEHLPGSDLLQNALFNSCAIVGNSGFNLLFRDGHLIDNHDAVFRLFDGPTVARSGEGAAAVAVDFTAFVGRRSTMRVVDEDTVGFSEGGEITLMNVASKKGFYGHFQFLNEQPDAKSFLFDPEFSTHVTDNIGPLPSPLAMTLFLALQKCASLDVFGVHWRPGYGVPELYYRETDSDADVVYQQPADLQLVETLARLNLVGLGQPCVIGCEAETRIRCDSCSAGSSCACGRHNPLPVALPGFCHLPGNYTCFFRCDGNFGNSCQGGPGSSLCPDDFDIAGRQCAVAGDTPPPEEAPWWARRGSMREFDSKFERAYRQLRKQKIREAKERARSARAARLKKREERSMRQHANDAR